jgi:hypothetical protein
MLELRRKRLVAGDRGPVVGQHPGFGAAKVHHRLDGEEHAFLQHRACARAAVVQHVGRRVEHPAKAMPAEVAHHAHAVGLDMGLDRMADVAKGGAGPHRLDARISASCVTWIRRVAKGLAVPATYIRLVSPNQPSTITVTSMFRMSPSAAHHCRAPAPCCPECRGRPHGSR